jgi:probable phosphoglycerate mutase
MTTTKLFVVRHGQTTHNRDGLISGYFGDPLLTQQGIAQAEDTREKLSHIHFDEAYSSDLKRAVHTAAIIYGQDIHPSKQMTELRERTFGTIEGQAQTRLDGYRELPHFQAMNDEERWHHKFEDDMESDHEVSTRFIGALKKIAEDNIGKTVLVAAHGGTLRTLLIGIGFAKSSELPFGSIGNAAFIELDYKDGSFTTGQLSGIKKSVSS